MLLSKLSAFRQSENKIQIEEFALDRSPEYQANINLQEYLHPYLIDRVEPSIQHIIFSSYIKY
ncbi:MAG: hypothetical protein AAF915_07670 [Cyanobacteria bacterium P01_D01_bin.50]